MSSLNLTALFLLAKHGHHEEAATVIREVEDDDMISLHYEITKFMQYLISLNQPNVWQVYDGVFQIRSFAESCFKQECYNSLVGVPKELLSVELLDRLISFVSKTVPLKPETLDTLESFDYPIPRLRQMVLMAEKEDLFIKFVSILDQEKYQDETIICSSLRLFDALFARKGLISEGMLLKIARRSIHTYSHTVGRMTFTTLSNLGQIAIRRNVAQHLPGHLERMHDKDHRDGYAPFFRMRGHLINLILCFRRVPVNFFVRRQMLDAVWDACMCSQPIIYGEIAF
jgi:hypothetical protein